MRLSGLHVNDIVEARIDVDRQFAELRPFLAELRRLVRGLKLLRISPLDVVDRPKV